MEVVERWTAAPTVRLALKTYVPIRRSLTGKEAA
jgi:hypothetical protein